MQSPVLLVVREATKDRHRRQLSGGRGTRWTPCPSRFKVPGWRWTRRWTQCANQLGSPCTGCSPAFPYAPRLGVDVVEAFLHQLLLIHARGRRNPEPAWDAFRGLKQLAGGLEVTNVGHAGADEDLLDFRPGHLREGLHVIGSFGHASRGSVISDMLISMTSRTQRSRRRAIVGFASHSSWPLLAARGSARRRSRWQSSNAASPRWSGRYSATDSSDRSMRSLSGALGGGIGEPEGLLHGEVREPLNLEDTAVVDVLLCPSSPRLANRAVAQRRNMFTKSGG